MTSAGTLQKLQHDSVFKIIYMIHSYMEIIAMHYTEEVVVGM